MTDSKTTADYLPVCPYCGKDILPGLEHPEYEDAHFSCFQPELEAMQEANHAI